VKEIMKVILLKNTPKVGRAGEVVEVSDGYAKNFIIAKGYGKAATTGVLKQYQTQQNKRRDELKEEIVKLAVIKKRIEATEFELTATADSTGGINGKITPKQVISKINETLEVKLDKKMVEKKDITGFGISTIKIELFKGLIAEAKINVRRK
jgi:large subunit ribosomal protein L9